MKILGVTGGIASGKSAVTAVFARLGAVCFDADEAAHRYLLRPEFKQAAYNRWGPEIFLGLSGRPAVFPPDISPNAASKSEGAAEFWVDYVVDRRALGQIVFDPDDRDRIELDALNALVHPRISKEFVEEISRLANAGKTSLVVLDVPLLFESRWNKICSEVVCVVASPANRLERVKKRGWSEEELRRRESFQFSPDEKRRRSNFVIYNDGSLEDIERQATDIFNRLAAK